MDLTKESLYNQIQKYLYSHNFADLKVFSKQYFHSIMVPCYSDNSQVEPYSVISIDFNNMQKINERGMKRGDKILHDSIELMQNVLPKNSYCVRNGGDEFLFFLNGLSKEDALEYETKIHEQLSYHSKKIKGATVTSYTVSSKDAQDIASLVDIADSAINTIKQTAKETKNIDNWDILQNKATENFSTFFKTLRFHNFPMETTHLKNILLDVINSYDTFINEETNTNIQLSEENTHSEFMHKNYYLDNLQDLNNLFIKNKDSFPSSNELDNFETSTFVNVLNYLIRDPLTMQFNKSYLVNHLLENKKQNFKALRISSAFVKVSNTLNDSHSSTDKQIKKTGNEIYDFLNDKIHFNQDPFSSSPMNYMIALDGGDMMLALNPDTDLDVHDIKDFLNVKNQEEYSSDNLLRLVVADNFQALNKRNFSKILLNQSKECNKNKIPLISKLLDDDIVADLLNVTLRDTMNFYKDLVDDPKDISAKTKYVDLISRTILDLYSSLDVVHDNIKPQSNFTKFSNKIASIFKKKQLSLPSASAPEIEKQSRNKNKNIFIPKVKIDYSKIKNVETNNLNNEKNIEDR